VKKRSGNLLNLLLIGVLLLAVLQLSTPVEEAQAESEAEIWCGACCAAMCDPPEYETCKADCVLCYNEYPNPPPAQCRECAQCMSK